MRLPQWLLLTAFIAAIFLLWSLRELLLLIFAAVVLAMALCTLVGILRERRPMQRPLALLDTPWKAAAVLGAYVVIQNIESYVITPSVMHHQVKLLPGLTLAAQFLFTLLFGPLGLLMALPLAVVLQVTIREVIIHDVLDRWKRLEPVQ